MPVRFLKDGRVRSDRGTDLTAGQTLTSDEARAQVDAGVPAVLRNFPRITDLTKAEAIALLPQVRHPAALFDHDAVLYSGGQERVLVFTFHH